MIEPSVIAIAMGVSFLVMLVLGLPIAFITGGLGVLFMTFLWGPQGFLTMALTATAKVQDFMLVAVPLFIMMGSILQKSGVAEDLFNAIWAWFGRLRGGLAMGTILMCAVFAAMVGTIGAEITVTGIIALPNLLKYKYDKHLALGTVLAGSGLGPLIPPSVLFIVYGTSAGISIGKLFISGFPAGILLSTMFILYIGIRSFCQKGLCPIVPESEMLSLKEKLRSLKGIVLPGLVIVLVLGAIFTGTATPTESAGVGVVGAILAAVVNKRMSWKIFKEAMIMTMSTTSMVMWVIIGASIFVSVFAASGAANVVKQMMSSLSLGPIGMLILMMGVVFLLGMFIDPISIIMLTLPVFMPIILSTGLDPVWFGCLFVINLLLGCMTPPFGVSLFYLKAVTPEGITMSDLYRSVWPFVGVSIVSMALIIMFPQTISWAIKLSGL